MYNENAIATILHHCQHILEPQTMSFNSPKQNTPIMFKPLKII